MKWKTKAQEDAALWRGLVMSGEKMKGGDLDAWGRALDCLKAEYDAAVAISNALPVGSSARNTLADTIDSVGQQLCDDLTARISRVKDYIEELEAKNAARVRSRA